MSKAKQETIADIVAAMRNEGHAGDASCLEWVSAKFTSYADRIEAAAKREHEATRERSSRVGNTAKMREAFVDVYNTLEKLNPYTLHINDISVRREFRSMLCHAKNVIDFTLSAPPRNCDVGTAEEQSRRYEELCDRHTCGSRCSASGCPMYEHDCSPFAWSQMPYEEGDAK